MKIGIYGGTFDPIHHGHLILARAAREQFELDTIVFIPAAISPHKLAAAPTPSAVRWEMICASIDGEPHFSADDLELHRDGPSYTYDTALAYRLKYPGAELFYFIGADNLRALHTWHRIEELKQLVTLIVFDRSESSSSELAANDFPTVFGRFDISASDIRNRVAKGLSIRYLVTSAVDELIRRHHLYPTPNH